MTQNVGRRAGAYALLGIIAAVIIYAVIFFGLTGAAQNNSAADAAEENLKVLIAGDVMLGRFVESLRKEQGNNYPFLRVRETMIGHDSVLINLEGPIPARHERTPSGSTRFSFEEEIAPLLREHNVRFVSLANNHTYDFGREGHANTIRKLSENDIAAAGSYDNSSRKDAFVISKGNQSVLVAPFNFVGPKTANLAVGDIQALRNSYPYSHIMAYVHWGDEYTRKPNDEQKRIARNLIDAGADAVIGHHPHVVQTVEEYKGRPIFYSLGNFIFDQYFSSETQEGLMLSLSLSSDFAAYSLLPYLSIRSQPAYLETSDRETWLESFGGEHAGEFGKTISSGKLIYSRIPE